MLRQASTILSIRANRPGLHEFTDEVRSFVAGSGMSEGLLTLFCRHTSASLVIQEHAAPAARRDLEAYFARLAPENWPYEHDDEGPDDMPAHLRTALTQTQLSIPVRDGEPVLRRNTPERQVALHLLGE
jgi:secondary thiamine-phosphate synthase enzyme